MKTKKQLEALIKVAREQKSRGALKGHAAELDESSTTNSWGPQMRV